jgi:signal transduction histidine kinase
MTLSIRTRLTLWYSVVVVAVLMTGAFAVAIVQKSESLERLDEELQRLMLTLEGVMRTEFGEGLDLQAAADEASIEVVAPDRSLVLTRPDGTVLAIWGQPLAARWLPPTDAPSLETVIVSGARYRVVSRPVMHAGHHYVAAVMAPLSELETEQRELIIALWTGILVALLVATGGGWVVGRQTLRPLTALADQATAITERDLSARLRPSNARDELGQFATAFNELLDRLAGALNAQRQFMADASHELRNPVSVVRTTAQVTLARPQRSESEYHESLTIVAEQAVRLSRLVDAMFLLSRAEAQGIPLMREPVYVDDLVADCVRALRIVAEERRITVRTDVETEVMFSGDNTLLRQMVGNLLDNAIRHAKSLVTASVSCEPSVIVIRIRDDGTGVPEDQRDRIFERFARLDPRPDGAGLGLPIARWIAQAHGGTLVLESSGRDGSCFMVTLPIR